MEDAKQEPPKPQTTKEPLGLGEVVTGMFFIWLIVVNPIWMVWILTPCRIKYPMIYAPIYQIGLRQVHAVEQPTDCGWWRAPLGDKGCRYKKQVLTEKNAAGNVTDVLVTWGKVQE